MPRTPLPLSLEDSPFAAKALAALLGSWAIAASAWVQVPMVPVPMTMQTFAVLVAGALGGWRLGAATLALYLAQGFVGMPVLAGGGGGPAYFMGPTAGYLLAFPAAAALVGFLAERGWTRRWPTLLAGFLLGHGVILAGGAAWLATLKGWEVALAAGVAPFLAATLLKSALAAATVRVVDRLRKAG